MTGEQVGKDRVVTFSYVLKDAAGVELEKSPPEDPTIYLHGHRNILRGVEEALAGKGVGDELSVTLPPERAFGVRNESALQRVPIKHLLTRARRYTPGMLVKINTRDGARDARVVKAGKFNVDLDLNHPLAGQTVTFDIRVEQVRDATAEERAHGHAHGATGEAHAH